MGYLRNPIELISGIGLIETYNTRVPVGAENEFEDILMKRHLCGALRVIEDKQKGFYLVDEWKDRNNCLRRRILLGRVAVDENADEKILIYEKCMKNGKKVERPVTGHLRTELGEGMEKNTIMEEIIDENGDLIPVAEVHGELIFKRDEDNDKEMITRLKDIAKSR